MLKKVGIVAATATAALLAVSPLAFAGDKGGDSGGHHHGNPDQVNISDSSKAQSQSGLINVGNIDALNNPAICPAVNANVVASVLGVLGGQAAGGQDDGSGAAAACAPGSTNQENSK